MGWGGGLYAQGAVYKVCLLSEGSGRGRGRGRNLHGITQTPCCGRLSCCSSGTRPAPLPSLIEPAANRDVSPSRSLSICVHVCVCVGVPVRGVICPIWASSN